MDQSKRTVGTDNFAQIGEELREAFTGKTLRMQTTAHGIIGDVEWHSLDRVVAKNDSIAIMLETDFILLLANDEATVQWLSDSKVEIVDGEITTHLWVAP